MGRETITYRLGVSGERDVQSALDRITEAGVSGEKKVAAAFEQSDRVAQAALARRARLAEQVAKLAGSDVQRSINANTGVINVAEFKSAEQSMMAFIRAQDELAQSRERLLAAVDPLFGAQQRYNAVMAEAMQLERQGALAEGELATVHARARAELDQVRGAQQRYAQSSGAMLAGTQQLGFQVSDFAVQMAGGTSAIRAFALQAPQAIQAIALMGQGATGSAGKFASFARFLGGPWGAAILAGTSIAAALGTKLLETGDDALELATHLKDVALVSDGVSDAQSVLAKAFDLTTGALEHQNSIIRTNIALMSAKLRAEASRARTAAFDAADYAGERSLSPTSIFAGSAFFPQQTIARSKLRGVIAGKLDPSQVIKWAEKADFSGLRLSQSEFIDAVARAAEVTAKNATADAIDESMRSGKLDAAFRQDRGPGRTRRARKGREDHSAEREAAKEARELQNALDALTSAYDPLSAAETKRAEDLANIGKALKAGKIDQARADVLTSGVKDDFFATAFGDIEKAGEASMATAGNDALARDRSIGDYLADQDRARQLADLEATSLRKGADEREREQAHLSFILDLERQGLPLWDARVRALILGNDELVKQGQEIERVKALMEEQRRTGEQVIDTLFDPQNWNDWGEMGKRIIQQLIQEMLTLAAINPLKNMLLGENLPTASPGGFLKGLLGTVIGAAAGAAGGGASAPGFGTILPSTFRGRAIGTEYDDGGWHEVGEFGKELVRMPRGTQVLNAGRTRQAERGGGHSMVVNYHVNADGADPSQLRRLTEAFQQLNATLEQRAIGAVVDANQRTYGGLLRV